MPSWQFRPRYRALAWLAVGLGAGGIAATAVLAWPVFAYAFGGAGTALGSLYLASPTWRYRVTVDDDGLEVTDNRGNRRFRLAWDEVDRCIVSRDTKTCVVSGGSAERTFIVPGPGALAPYDIADKQRLFDEIVRRVPPDKIEEVDLVERAER